MIIVRLAGGLGNQLFQYAFGRALAHYHKVALKVDTHWLSEASSHPGETARDYQLDLFATPIDVATRAEIRRYVPFVDVSPDSSVLRYAKRAIQRVSRALNPRYVVERDANSFDPAIWQRIPADCYVTGYWQSEAYFADIQHQLRSSLCFAQPLGEKAARLAQQLETVDSVCVHVRRTDFLSDPKQTTLTLGHIEQAVRELLRRSIKPYLFVFSDDIVWCQQNLLLDNVPIHYVSNEEIGRDLGDHFQLMTRCRHFILSVSTFGWWAAWLATYPQKMVLHPPHRTSNSWSADGWLVL